MSFVESDFVVSEGETVAICISANGFIDGDNSIVTGRLDVNLITAGMYILEVEQVCIY